MCTISLCMIVKDEEIVIERCIDSVKDVIDEIIIVDTGSTDSTIEKAKKYSSKIYKFKWIDDFAVARNYAFDKATKDYIFWIDADDVLDAKSKEDFLKLKDKLNDNVDYVTMDYILSLDINNNPLYISKRNRLVKREKNFKWIGKVHEYLEVSGRGLFSDISIRHLKIKNYTNRNLLIYKKMIENGEKLSTRDLYYYANELKDNGLYKEAINEYNKFLSLKDAWIEDTKAACEKIADCYLSLGNRDKEIKSLLYALKYDVPSPNLSVRLGEYFMREGKFKIAIFWFNEAINYKKDPNSLAIINNANITWVPALELCVCYYNLGDYEKAYYYNEEAAKFVPEHSSVVYNKKLFESMEII